MRTCGESPRMRVIGMLGGMSRESTAQYYRLCSLPRRGTGDTQGRLRRRGRAHAEVRLRARRLGRAGAGPRARRAPPGGARRQPRNLAIDTGQAACAASPRDAVGSGNRGGLGPQLQAGALERKIWMNSRIHAGWSGQARAETICPSTTAAPSTNSPPAAVTSGASAG